MITPGAERSDVIRVASVPAGHGYVAALELPRAGIEVLPDPPPPGAPPGQWWPPVALGADWIDANAGRFDVLHLHFGSESFTLPELDGMLAALRRAGRALVYTVHDLEHPQLADGARHRAQLDRLIPAADGLITLTAGAAAEIDRRWGRRATVIAHPRMLDPRLAAEPSAHPGFVAGLHLRDLRPNIDGVAVTRGLVGAVEALRADGLEVRGHIVMFDRVRDEAAAGAIRAACAERRHVVLHRRPRLSDAELVDDLLGLDLSILPYRHGTHSGWAELCWDLGLPVAGAPIGYVEGQHAEPGWFAPCDPADPASLAAVVGRLAAGCDASGEPPLERRRRLIATRRMQRDQLAPILRAAHRAVYERALGARPRSNIAG